MSTKSAAHRDRPQCHQAIDNAPEASDHWTGPRYRCLYCRKEFKAVEFLPGHEASCDARLIVRRGLAGDLRQGEAGRRVEEGAQVIDAARTYAEQGKK